jgi:hypothetical protein
MKTYWGGGGYIDPYFLDVGILVGGEWSASRPCVLPPRNELTVLIVKEV